MDVAVRKDLGKGVINPEGLRECGYYGKNDSVDTKEQGLSYSGLTKAFRNSYIVNRYKFEDEIAQRTATIDFPKRRSNSAGDMDFRKAFLVYLRDIDRVLGNLSGENRWRNAEPYDHTRKPKKGKVTMEKVKMPIQEHARGEILGVGELTIAL